MNCLWHRAALALCVCVLPLLITACGLGEDSNNDNPLTVGREATGEATVSDLDSPVSFKSTGPAGTHGLSKNQAGYYASSLLIASDSKTPSVNINLTLIDPDAVISPGEYAVILPDPPARGAAGTFVIGQNEAPVYGGSGSHMSGMVKITSISAPNTGAVKASGTYTLNGSGVWTAGYEGEFTYEVSGEFKDVPLAVVP